ncbi:hypothetical protein LOTGIDRAFT_233518 [Lottia gigantea]|uniref:Uncharacterized protein n=1 Tax=Lottia gigantea TaxID=225164 RepID=V4A2V3_LOTGI|nr:hypothetical protein LOTGIDRAFT_233518 [Lottia gigantea]ESO91027.1 hypothetical protein LOTGIDRAFT_233518 [Lottia gigantea]
MDPPPLIPVEYYRYILIGLGVYFLWINIILIVTLITLSIAAFYGTRYYLKRNKPKIDVKGKAIFITGCDTGFGFDLALLTNDQGFIVFAGCLKPDGSGAKNLQSRSSDRIQIVPLDVTSDDSVANALQCVTDACQSRKLELWGVVNNAGINYVGPIELNSLQQIDRVCDINLFGTVRVTKAFLSLLRQSQGRVINISSERGVIFRALSAAYCMSKAGMETFSDSLRLEMARFGIKVSIVEPGHYGQCTAIVAKNLIDHNKKTLHEEFESSPEGVKYTYCKYDIDSIFASADFSPEYKGPRSSHENTLPVINCIANCLIDPLPRERYIVGGTRGWYDPRTICSILKPILPDKYMDMVINYYF